MIMSRKKASKATKIVHEEPAEVLLTDFTDKNCKTFFRSLKIHLTEMSFEFFTGMRVKMLISQKIWSR